MGSGFPACVQVPTETQKKKVLDRTHAASVHFVHILTVHCLQVIRSDLSDSNVSAWIAVAMM